MNTRLRKSIFWSGIIAAIVLATSFTFHVASSIAVLITGSISSSIAGSMGSHSGFGHEQIMGGFYQGAGFSWIGFLFLLIIAVTVIVLAGILLNNKNDNLSTQQSIDNSNVDTPQPAVSINNASFLDEWEKNNLNMKERI